MQKPDKYTVYFVLVDKETEDFMNDILFTDRSTAVRFKRDFCMPEAEVRPIHGWAAEKMSPGWNID